MALAYWLDREVEAGRLRDYTHAAAVLGVSRARVSQIVRLVLLPLAEQERLLLQGR